MKQGLILFGHGARDPRWKAPFEQLAKRLGERFDNDEAPPSVPVALAFLEMMTPSLAEAVAALVAQHCTIVTVIPVFFGQGAHLRRDYPVLLDACRAAHPQIDLRSAMPVGEVDAIQTAIVEYAAAQLTSSSA